jgi:hypothetical protein
MGEIIKLGEAGGFKGWATIEGRIYSLNGPGSEKVQQSGMLSDGTGVARFVIFSASGIDSLEYDKSYRLEGVFIEMWNGQPSIKINRRTEITQIPDLDLAAEDVPGRACISPDSQPARLSRRVKRAAQAVKAGQQATIFAVFA